MKSRLRFVALLGTLGLALVAVVSAESLYNNVGSVIEDLKDLRYSGEKPQIEGQPYILEFWATWCPHCRSSIPRLNELHDKYHDQGLEIIGVTDESRSTVRNFMRKTPIQFTVGYDVYDKVGNEFGVSTIPHALLVDRNGKVVWEGEPSDLRAADIEKAMSRE
jgi:thiol-disulfide isomerase/thioredoxin